MVPVVGAGFSTAAGLPSTAELTRRLRDLAGDGDGDGDGDGELSLFAAADAAYRAGAADRAEINRMVADWLGLEENPKASPTAIHQQLVRVPSHLIVTFNYDLLFERAAEKQGVEFESLTYRDRAKLSSHLRSRGRSRLCIYHAHGSVDDPDSLVLDDESYRRMINDHAAIAGLEILAELSTLCFLGTRLDEPYLQTMLLRLPTDHPRHVLVCDEGTAAEATGAGARGALLPTRFGIVTSTFPAGEWRCLESFCERLATQRQSPRSISLPARAHAPYAKYVEPPILIRARDAHSEVLAYLKLALQEDEEIDLADVVRAGRALVVGPAGCGKSSLLHRLGSVLTELEPPVRINLGSVTRFRGSPAELLRHWLRNGTGFHDEGISPDSRAVLLLDGLDEVDLGQQLEAARAIAALADAFPQHRFIVASRLIPAMQSLAEAGFVEFEIHPTHSFAETFLKSFGWEIKDLKQRLPEVVHLGALGSNPFVLAELVRLVDAVPTDLSTTDRFHWLMGELIDAFTKREAERLAYSTGALREAVGELAATMSLLGLRTLDVTTYPFDTDEPIIADHSREEFVQEAARRLLVWAERSQFAFTEPVVETFLAAEHILRLDPDGEKLTVAVAPSFKSRKELKQEDGSKIEVEVSRSGVRADLTGLAGLLASLSPGWAESLFARAPALVARAVPPEAAHPPPRLRAEALWEHLVSSVDERSQRKLPQTDPAAWLPSETSALAAVLRHHRQPALQERIRRTALRASAPPALRARALEALAGSGRLSGKTLDRLAAEGDVPWSAICFAIKRLQRPSLLEALALWGAERPHWVGDSLARRLAEMMTMPGTGDQLLGVLAALDPKQNPRYFWQLVGVVRLHGAPAELVGLWRVLLVNHREALEEFGEAMPAVLGYMGMLALSEDPPLVDTALMDEMSGLIRGLEPNSTRGATLREKLLTDPAAESPRPPKKAEGPKGRAAKSPRGTKVSHDGVEAEDGVPVLLVRSELGQMMRNLAYGLGAERELNLISGLPPKMVAEKKARAANAAEADDKGTDPLVAFEAELDRLPQDHDWGSLERLLDPLRGRPFALRAAIGARLEQRLPALTPDAGTPDRARLLQRYGRLLVLRPSHREWAITAIEGRFDRTDWLKAVAPPVEQIRETIRGSEPGQLPDILNAMPAELRAQVVDDVAAVLAAADPRSEVTELAVARACADGAGSPEAILRLAEILPDAPPLFAGWAAATGNEASIPAAFAHVIAEVEGGRAAELVDSVHLGWVESTLGLLGPDSLESLDLLKAFMKAFIAQREDSRVEALCTLLGVTACAVEPLRIAVVLEFARRGIGWAVHKEPFAALALDAEVATHREAGSRAAAEILGIGLSDLKGERAVT